MLDKKEVQEAIDKFRKYVIQQSRSNLSKQRKNFSKSLYNSISGVSKVNPNSISLYFEMEEHGLYQDKGVRGKDPSKVSPNAKIKGQQAPDSPYRFGSGKSGKSFNQFVNSLEKWVKNRGLRFRNEKGQYKAGNTRAVAFVTAANIYNRGLKPSLFFTKPFDKAFESLPEELVEAYGIDVINTFIKDK